MSSRQFFAGALIAAHTLVVAAGGADFTTITAAPTPTGQAKLVARATTSPLPLTEYKYPYSAVPYQVNPFPVGRGPQTGYNRCNSTTEGASSECQTLVVNSVSDFCLWGSPVANGVVGNIEAETVAYCAQKGHGSRIITPGTITAVQFIKTSKYIQVTGLLDQRGIGLDPTDSGGELDPHGADLLGNPLGGLVYSTALPGGSNNTYIQSESWTNFIGSNQFCFKVCFDNSSPNYCENRYDTVGCNYNMPASYKDNEFTSCDGELQDVVGTYVTNGQTMTWDQNSGGDPPYTPRIPATSNCQTFQSTNLFAAATSSAGSSSAASSAASTASGSATTGSSSTGTQSASRTTSASPSASSSGSASSQSAANLGLFAILGLVVAFN